MYLLVVHVQALLARMLPIHGLGDFISLLHLCLLYSLYAFEYKWFNMGRLFFFIRVVFCNCVICFSYR